MRAWPVVVVGALLPIWLIGLFGRSYWTPDEPREADIAWHMMTQPDKSIPEFAGKPFAEKPPLAYWLAATSMSLLGSKPAAARLPNLIYAALTVLAVAGLAKAMRNSLAAVVAGLAAGSFQLAYQDPNWDWTKFDIDRDVKFVDEKTGFVNATDPDLSKFKARGGKVLMYHGWNDVAISPQNSIDYYNSVLAKMGRNQNDFIRLFMVPGMGHCQGGPGPDQVNYMSALERWREAGEAPASLTASRVVGNRVDMTRPLCAYPQVATYKGTGSTNDAANFVCK